jgi:hypothetical protein
MFHADVFSLILLLFCLFKFSSDILWEAHWEENEPYEYIAWGTCPSACDKMFTPSYNVSGSRVVYETLAVQKKE